MLTGATGGGTVAFQMRIAHKQGPGRIRALGRVSRFLSAVLIAGGALTAIPGTAWGVTGQQAIVFLNAQRVANGLPGGIVEDPEWSEGCRLHVHYTKLNGGIDFSNPHDEEPSKPGFTLLGQQAAQSAVLGASFGADGSNGWEEAPIHLMQTLGPGLSVTGYADGCLWTWPGYQRPAPEQTALYSYPNGTTISYSETAAEWPYVPGEFVGLPGGTTTGPYLYVFAFGQSAHIVQLTSASLTGPAGPVEVRTVDDTTTGPLGDLGGYLPPGGMVIPVLPLHPESLYTANVTGMSGGHVLTWTFSFNTALSPNSVRIDPGYKWDRSGRWTGKELFGIESRAPNPIFTLTNRRGRVTTLALHPTSKVQSTGYYLRTIRLAAGPWLLCVKSGGPTTGYAAASHCQTFRVARHVASIP
jgi:hypothetical protein